MARPFRVETAPLGSGGHMSVLVVELADARLLPALATFAQDKGAVVFEALGVATEHQALSYRIRFPAPEAILLRDELRQHLLVVCLSMGICD